MLNVKKQNKLFTFFKVNHNLYLTSYEIEEIINEVNSTDEDIVKKINYKINMYRFINISIVLLILITFNKSIMQYGLIIYLLLNTIILLYSIYQEKKKQWK